MGLSRFAGHRADNFQATATLTAGYPAGNADSAAERQSAVPSGIVGEPTEQLTSPQSVAAIAALDTRLVKESFGRMLQAGPAAMEYFYSRLFAANPECRALFPTSMTVQRERMLAALARLVWTLDNQQACAEDVGQLSRQHRRFGVMPAHYEPFFTALLDTVEHFTGSAWTAEAAAAWRSALDFLSATMRAAAEEDAKTSPPWWVGEIVAHELRAPGVAVIRLRPNEPLSYQPGQYVPVQVTRWPRVWRNYSIANAPRPGGPIELHVKAIPGGQVSNTLVYHSAIGDCMLIGAAEGAMTLASPDRDLLCVAGGTGLAPIKAIIEQALADQCADGERKITLFFGARQHFDLYDLADLQLLESACPALRVLPVLSDEPGYRGLAGTLPEIVGGNGLFGNAEAYICGPPAMVRMTAAVLAASIPPGHIHHDPLP